MNKEYQEALDTLKYHYENPRRHYFNMGANEPHKYFNTLQEAIDKANKYDEKETPKKAIKKRLFYNCREGICDKAFIYYCPICGTSNVEDMNYCFECGNKLEGNKE